MSRPEQFRFVASSRPHLGGHNAQGTAYAPFASVVCLRATGSGHRPASRGNEHHAVAPLTRMVEHLLHARDFPPVGLRLLTKSVLRNISEACYLFVAEPTIEI